MKIDVKVMEVGKTDKEMINKGHVESYKMKARDADGLNEVQINSASPFDGFAPNQIITLNIENSQTSLDDFDEAMKAAKEAKKAEKEEKEDEDA